MSLSIKRNNLSDEEKDETLKRALKFFNSKAKDLYKSDSEIVTADFKNRFKATFLNGMIDFERVIRGSFGSDLSLRYADISILKKMFPYACNQIFDVDNNLLLTGETMESLRNINAHAFLSPEDYNLFDRDFSFLESAPKFNDQLKYCDGNEITIGGLTFILLTLLREESIQSLCKKFPYINVLVNGDCTMTDCSRFVEEISKTNLEIDLRENVPETFEDAVLGSYKDAAIFNGDAFTFVQGSESMPIVKIECECFSRDFIKVKEGSLTRVYYNEGFALSIKEPALFVELSRQLPAFALVDYLFKLSIDVFDKQVYETLKNDYLLFKLNKPKFYVDKNIGVILLSNTCSDYRIISSILTDGLNALFLSLEEYFYSEYGLKDEESYSTLRIALNNVGVKPYLRDKIVSLRNIAAHGYMFGDHSYLGRELVEFDVKCVTEILARFVKALKSLNKKAYEFAATRITRLIIERTIFAKYRKIDEVCFAYLTNNGNSDIDLLKKKYLFVERSYFDTTSFNYLSMQCCSHHRILEINLPELDFPLYLIANKGSIELIDKYISNKGYTKEVAYRGMIISYSVQ